jgi:hypothetical protein
MSSFKDKICGRKLLGAHYEHKPPYMHGRMENKRNFNCFFMKSDSELNKENCKAFACATFRGGHQSFYSFSGVV